MARRSPGRIIGLGAAGFVLASAAFVYPMARHIEAGLQGDADAALREKGMDWARVRMDGQTAFLSGFAPSPTDRELALSLAAGAHGHGGWFLGGVTRVIDHTSSLPRVSPFVWSAERGADGKLTIRGYATTRMAKHALAEYAAGLFGAPPVDDSVLAMGAPRGDWTDAVKIGLAQLARLDNGRIELRDRALTVTGSTPDARVAAAARAAMASLPDPFQGGADITLTGKAAQTPKVKP